ncbi:MAG: hypothetical protein M0P64_01355 [Candidatus Pacebacteria bacterium]|jgi:hypothetical protein|nr:hypothetical protein [Candidatus Paceibacterota bacterium]
MKSYPQIPTSLLFLLIVIAVVNGIAETYHWYWVYRWFDIPMHFSGGMWLAGMGLWWAYFRKGTAPQSFLATWATAILFAFSIGFLWEVYEAVISFATVGHMNDILDTLGDLLFDILGGTAVAVLVQFRAKLKV